MCPSSHPPCLRCSFLCCFLCFTSRKKHKLPRAVKYVDCRTYRNFTDVSFQRDVANIDWANTLELLNPNEIAKDFTQKFNKVMDHHAPLKRLKIREHAPDWLNTDYLAHIDERE